MNPVAPHPPLTEYYGEAGQREEFVRDIFDETAPWYDWGARFLSFGSGDWYREQALRRLGLEPGMKLLDLATGTGVVARAALKIMSAKNIVGADVSIGMLVVGRTGNVRVQTPAERLPFRSESFDRITIGFALRHFADLSVVFEECHRVLRRGGKLMILEITAPESRLARGFLGVYMGRFAPFAIRIRSGSVRTAQLFRYYWETTRDCVRPNVILHALRQAGFSSADRNVEMGIFSEYVGTKD